jgi:hypothetical protein
MPQSRHPLAFVSLLLVALLSLAVPAEAAEPLEGDYLYRVTTLRAAPGKFSDLLDWYGRLVSSGYMDAAGTGGPLLMRHSQGDQWDLMVITPMKSWEDWFSPAATERRQGAAAKFDDLGEAGLGLVAFEEDVFAWGPAWPVVRDAHAGSALFHIEMFHALPGKSAELLEQRRMENNYLAATGQVTNLIFKRSAGSDVDVFTIGFHESLETFAAPAPATDEEKEAAARAAGFKDRADLSFYLRSLIAGHHDTLAGRAD